MKRGAMLDLILTNKKGLGKNVLLFFFFFLREIKLTRCAPQGDVLNVLAQVDGYHSSLPWLNGALPLRT